MAQDIKLDETKIDNHPSVKDVKKTIIPDYRLDVIDIVNDIVMMDLNGMNNLPINEAVDDTVIVVIFRFTVKGNTESVKRIMEHPVVLINIIRNAATDT